MKNDKSIQTDSINEVKYEIVFVDNYNNWYLIGFFDNLIDAETEVNSYLKDYTPDKEEYPYATNLCFGEDTALGHLTLCPSTFGYCFDRTISTEEGGIEVRGFILNKQQYFLK